MSIDDQLEAIGSWAEERLRTGAEPPFIYYRLMQLREAAKELMPHARRLAEGSQEPNEHLENVPQQAAQGSPPNIVPLHPFGSSSD